MNFRKACAKILQLNILDTGDGVAEKEVEYTLHHLLNLTLLIFRHF